MVKPTLDSPLAAEVPISRTSARERTASSTQPSYDAPAPEMRSSLFKKIYDSVISGGDVELRSRISRLCEVAEFGGRQLSPEQVKNLAQVIKELRNTNYK